MTSVVPMKTIFELRDLLLRFESMANQNARNLYVTTLETQLGQPLTASRHGEPNLDVYSIIKECLNYPGALGTFVQIVESFHRNSYWTTDLERLVAKIERQTPLTTGERTSLTTLLAGTSHEQLLIAADRGLKTSATAVSGRPDLPSVLGCVIKESEDNEDPLIILEFADTLAHLAAGAPARKIHDWIDRVGERMRYDQGTIRDLCRQSREALTPGDVPVGAARGDCGVLGMERDPSHVLLLNQTTPFDQESHGDQGDVVRIAQEAPPSASEPVVIQRIWGGVPLRNPDFTGRQPLLRQLREELSRHKRTSVLPQTLHGLGGVGKTQLATEYVYRFGDQYDLVWWIAAERRTDVFASLSELGERLGIPLGDDMQQRAKTVVDALASTVQHRWLLVYDNAGRPDEINQLVPSAGGHVIVTSRDMEWTSDSRTIEVNVFAREESIELLHKRELSISEETANELAEKLGDLPLALEQAANFQLATGMPVEEYLELFDERVRELLSEGKPAGYHTTITAFLSVAFQQLREGLPAAAELLELFAYLGPEPISSALLRNGRSAHLSDQLRRSLRDSIQMSRMIRELQRLGLAKIDPQGQRIQVHRLVQAILRTELDETRRTQSRENVRNLLGAANPSRPDDPDTWAQHNELGPHIGPSDLIRSNNPEARLVAVDQARYLFVFGDYRASRDLGESMVAQWSKPSSDGGLGPNHEQTVLAYRHLANALRVLGDYPRARELDERAFRALKDNPEFGDYHEHTVGVALGLGFDYSMDNKLDQALQSDQENLARATRVYGESHEYTLDAKANVAGCLRQLGRFRQSYELAQQIVEALRKTLGNDKRRTVWAVSELVQDLCGLGQYQKALDIQREALERLAQCTKPHQREPLLSERNLVIALRKTGDFDGAVKRAKGNYNAFHTYFGKEHEHTLAAAMTYANALRAAGRLAWARSVAEEAVEGYTKKLGPMHRLTLAARVNQGIILRLLGERRSAYQCERDSYHALRECLGPEHPYVLCAANNYAGSLLLHHEVAAARTLASQSLEISRQVRGDDHPDALACAVNVAIIDLESDEDEAATQMRFDFAVNELRTVLGKNHPDVIDAERGRRVECDIEAPPA